MNLIILEAINQSHGVPVPSSIQVQVYHIRQVRCMYHFALSGVFWYSGLKPVGIKKKLFLEKSHADNMDKWLCVQSGCLEQHA